MPRSLSTDATATSRRNTATKHGLDKTTVLRDALTGQPWMPAQPAPT